MFIIFQYLNTEKVLHNKKTFYEIKVFLEESYCSLDLDLRRLSRKICSIASVDDFKKGTLELLI